MTNGQMILDDNSNAFRCFLGTLTEEDLATMLSGAPCNKCICGSYCDTVRRDSCQEIILEWLEQEG